MPLGAVWAGTCLAPGGPNYPDVEVMRDLCNCGYARGRCPHFPSGHEADAVRFSISVSESADAKTIYILEKDHVPVEHGDIESLSGSPAILTAQARAFLSSHERFRQASAPK